MTLEWKNVDIELLNMNKNRSEKYVRLITNANGIVKAGSLCAIMGPSGSGKTTLIKGLVGRIPSGARTKGNILVNGKERDYENWCKNIGYVDQDDCIYERLTVLETVTYAAEFRLKDQDINISKKVEDLFEELDILNKSGSKMNSISGGERKRVMIAIEIITEPNILFMDEPTSGLDSSTAFNFVNLMRKLSLTRNMSVIFTIHQPSLEIFAIFDQLILLSDSYTVFSGKAENAEEYFKAYGLKKRELSTFPDFLAEVLKVKHKYRELPEHQAILTKMIKDVEKTYPPSNDMAISEQNVISIGYCPNWKHIKILLHRKFKIDVSFLKILFTCVITCISFYFFYELVTLFLNKEKISYLNNFIVINVEDKIRMEFNHFQNLYSDEIDKIFKSGILMIPLGVLFAYPMISSTGVFSSEYKMIKRELGVATYSIGSYYLATFLFEIFFYLPFFILIDILMLILLYEDMAWEFNFWIILGPLAFIPIILFFGSLTKRTKTIYVIISFLALTWILSPSYYLWFHYLYTNYNNFIGLFFTIVGPLFPPLHYKALCIAISYKLQSSSSDFFKKNNDIKKICDQFATYLYSYLHSQMGIWEIFLLFIVTTILYVFFTVLALTLRLKPEQRFKLSK